MNAQQRQSVSSHLRPATQTYMDISVLTLCQLSTIKVVFNRFINQSNHWYWERSWLKQCMLSICNCLVSE